MEAFIQTFTNQRVYFEDPDTKAISITDIAHALSNICRYTGHCPKFYSVAQHSVLVSEVVHPRYALYGLLHDAAETYLNDLSAPFKHMKGMEYYNTLECKFESLIAKKYRLKVNHKSKLSVKQADIRMLKTEAEQFGMLKQDWVYYTAKHYHIKIEPWNPELAKEKFLDRFNELTGDVRNVNK